MRSVDPLGGSARVTAAPSWPSNLPHHAVATLSATSTTVIPSNGRFGSTALAPLAAPHGCTPYRRHREPAPSQTLLGPPASDETDPFAAALATRLDLEADDLLPRWLASSAAAALRLSIERWVAGGAEPAALGPLVDDALELVRHGVDGGSSGRPTT